MNRFISLSLETMIDNSSWEFGRRLFEIMIEADPRLMPLEVKRKKMRYACKSIADIEHGWAVPLKRTVPRRDVKDSYLKIHDKKYPKRTGGDTVQLDELDICNFYGVKDILDRGCVSYTSGYYSTDPKKGGVTLNASYDPAVEWQALFRQLCAHIQPFWATMHIPGNPETEVDKHGVRNWRWGYDIGGSGRSAKTGKLRIPNLACLNFIRDDMEDPAVWPQIEAAGFPVKRYLDGHLLKVTPDLDATLTDFPRFSEKRVSLKSFFPSISFYGNEPSPTAPSL